MKERQLSILPGFEESRSRTIPIAMILFGLIGVFVGFLDPSGGQRPSGLTPNQMQLVRADSVAGFPALPHPDNPPRGPGE